MEVAAAAGIDPWLPQWLVSKRAAVAERSHRPASALQARTTKVVQLVAELPALPADDGSRYSIRRLTASWLLESPTAAAKHRTLRENDTTLPSTLVSHYRDLNAFLGWCDRDRSTHYTARAVTSACSGVWRELHGAAGSRGQARHRRPGACIGLQLMIKPRDLDGAPAANAREGEQR